jgi:hypothetical protein
MTVPPSPVLFRSRWFPWIMLLVGLVIGYFIGKTSAATAPVTGDCLKGDSTPASINVSQRQCRLDCPSCTWVQDD